MPDFLPCIIEYLHNHDKVSAAWLFGSMATGKAGKDSDIDIAVLFAPGLSKYERFDLRLLIGGKLELLAAWETEVDGGRAFVFAAPS
jgi:predicted nucleotidyltransferase